MTNKERFNEHFARIAHREGTENLQEYLEKNNYFTSPSSSQFHGAKEEGNLEHSLNVTELMLKLKPVLASDISDESIVICGLFHDLGKANYYGIPTYVPNILKSGKASEDKPYKRNDDALPVPHEIASLHILSRFISLTPDETIAILYHNGLYVPLGREISGKETPLMVLLHFADMWASRFLEVE